jgi:hypothetical protein
MISWDRFMRWILHHSCSRSRESLIRRRRAEVRRAGVHRDRHHHGQAVSRRQGALAGRGGRHARRVDQDRSAIAGALEPPVHERGTLVRFATRSTRLLECGGGMDRYCAYPKSGRNVLAFRSIEESDERHTSGRQLICPVFNSLNS